MRNRFTTFFESPLIKNSTLLVGGNAGGQAIAMLIYPLLTRIYTEADFGVFALFFSITNILSILATGKYEEAIVLSKNNKETCSLVGFILKLLSAFSVIVFLVLWLAGKYIASIFDMEPLLDYWYLIPITVFFTGISFILADVATKYKKFNLMASSNLSLNGISSFFKLLSGYLSFNQIGLMVSTLAGQIASCLSYRKLFGQLKPVIRSQWKDEKQVCLKYKEFPMYSMTRNLISSFSANLPFLLLTSVFGEMSLGVFSLAYTMGFRPTALISASMYQVLYEKIVSMKSNNTKILPALKTYYPKIVLFLLPPCIIVFIISPTLFGFIFGSKWEIAGVYFRYLLPWVFMSIISNPLRFIPAIFNKQKKALWIETICTIARLGAMIGCIVLKDLELAIATYSLIGFLYAVITLIWYIHLIKKDEGFIHTGMR